MTANLRGRFITLEGAEGTGKSTQVPFITGVLEQRGVQVLCTREPGGTLLGERLRDILLNKPDPIQPDAELLMMFAARAQLIATTIRPALESGVWVICDRFTDATFAYQGGGRGIEFSRVKSIANWVHQGLQPDLTLLLDADPSVRQQRTAVRGQGSDRIERESDAFFERVRNAYLELHERYPQRIELIDANPEQDQVSAAIVALLDQRMDRWKDPTTGHPLISS